VPGPTVTCSYIEENIGVEPFLQDIRSRLKDGTYRPIPVRERAIPKKGSKKVRRLGIPSVTDRVVQMALKLVLEPIFEPDQYRSSYAYRPGRRAQDAVAEIVHYINNGYTWVVEGAGRSHFSAVCEPRVDRTGLAFRGVLGGHVEVPQTAQLPALEGTRHLSTHPLLG
jgi:RNA-directed DNA polymerase